MTTPGAATGNELDHELSALEKRLATLVEHAQALSAANETLRRDLATAQQRNQALAERVDAAAERLDALLARLPDLAQ